MAVKNKSLIVFKTGFHQMWILIIQLAMNTTQQIYFENKTLFSNMHAWLTSYFQGINIFCKFKLIGDKYFKLYFSPHKYKAHQRH